MDEDELVLIILGWPFLATTKAVIDVHKGKLSLRVGSETVTFNIGKSMKSKHSRDDYLYCADHTTKLVQEQWVDTIDHDRKQTEVEEEEDSNEVQAMLERLAGHEYYCFLDGFLGACKETLNKKNSTRSRTLPTIQDVGEEPASQMAPVESPHVCLSIKYYLKKGLDKAYDSNKTGLDDLEIDDLYNNLKAFEADIKISSGSSSNSQNVAFLSAEDTNSINEVNTANGVSTTAGHSSQGQASSSSYNDDLIFLFFANQSNSPQLDDEDLKQIDHDDLEEMGLNWQGAMFLLRVECFNVIEGDFAGNVKNKKINGTRMELKGLGAGTNQKDCTVETLCIGGSGHKLGLESVEAQLVVHQKNEVVYEEKIAVLALKVSKEKVNTVRVNGVNTAGQTAVSTVKGNEVHAVKPQAGEIHKQALKYKGMFDSRCSMHMTWNKALLTDYQYIDGGFVAFCEVLRGGTSTNKNRVAGREKKKDLIETARTMLAGSLIPIVFWAEAVNMACYVLNMVLVTKPHNKTPYELIIGRAPSSSDDKAKNNTVDDDACKKIVQEPASEYDQALKNVLDKMMDQEKEATE
ncbi:ribonuclease H-like domain-containing protein [Tanacetum coccineum]